MAVYLIPGHATGHALHIWAMGWQGPGALPVVVRSSGTTVAVGSQYQDIPTPQAFGQSVGLLSIADLVPGGLYELTFPGVDVQPERLRLQTLPQAISADGLVFLLASCYYMPRDNGLAQAVMNLPAHLVPAFKLLVGDQVYTDIPGLELNAVPTYPRIYREYWTSRKYQPFLAHSPNFFTCDDHEFWNNYPEWQIHIPRTYRVVRRQSTQAALQLYDLFQGVANPGGMRWYEFMIDPVSFFVADTRSERESFATNARLMSRQQEGNLRRWANTLTGPGILVLGQPLLAEPGDQWDRALADYSDQYALLWQLIEGAGHQILVLSGDIHIGRYASVPERPGVARRPRIAEFIASPSAFVSWVDVPVPVIGDRRSPVEAPRRVYPRGTSSPESRDVELQFGTNVDNFGLIQLQRLAPDRPRVRVTLQLWDVERQQLARSQVGPGNCMVEFDLE